MTRSDPDRNQKILVFRQEGETLAVIGARFGLTRSRIGQIVDEMLLKRDESEGLSPEPTKHEVVLEYCSRGFFGTTDGALDFDDRCPDCPGHPLMAKTKEWKAWDHTRDRRRRIVREAKKDERRRNRKPYPSVTPEKQCHAISARTGKQCRRSKVPEDPAELCSQHRRMGERYGSDELHRRAEAVVALVDSIVE